MKYILSIFFVLLSLTSYSQDKIVTLQLDGTYTTPTKVLLRTPANEKAFKEGRLKKYEKFKIVWVSQRPEDAKPRRKKKNFKNNTVENIGGVSQNVKGEKLLNFNLVKKSIQEKYNVDLEGNSIKEIVEEFVKLRNELPTVLLKKEITGDFKIEKDCYVLNVGESMKVINAFESTSIISRSDCVGKSNVNGDKILIDGKVIESSGVELSNGYYVIKSEDFFIKIIGDFKIEKGEGGSFMIFKVTY